MSRFRLTSEAESDLTLIWESIAQDDVAAAGRVVDALRHDMETLARLPQMAPERPGLSRRFPGLRAWPLPRYRNYIVFYVPTDVGILVVRILHAARNLEDIFADEKP